MPTPITKQPAESRRENMKDKQQNVLKGSEPGHVIHQRVDVFLR
jgi:hypothetical protein